jgi:putative endonuclease
MREHTYSVFFRASKSRVLYIGITNNLERRVWEHRHHVFDGFSKHYLCPRLVYFESYARVQNAIAREKQLQRWNRAKKIWLIERVNPTWEDLSSEWGQPLRKQLPPLAS